MPLRPWILFVAYRFFFSAWMVLNKSLLKYKSYQCFTGALVFDLRSQAQMVITYYSATTSNEIVNFCVGGRSCGNYVILSPQLKCFFPETRLRPKKRSLSKIKVFFP